MDRIEVVPVTGTDLEPEEAPARRTLDPLPVAMNLGTSPHDLGKGPAVESKVMQTVPVSADFAAGELAGLVSSLCRTCLHFRKDLWEKTLAIWRAEGAGGGTARQRILDRFQMAIARTMCDGEPSLEVLKEAERFMMKSGGICTVLSEQHGDVFVTYEPGACPEGLNAYQHRDRAAKRASSRAFDTIMLAAMNREPRP